MLGYYHYSHMCGEELGGHRNMVCKLEYLNYFVYQNPQTAFNFNISETNGQGFGTTVCHNEWIVYSTTYIINNVRYSFKIYIFLIIQLSCKYTPGSLSGWQP